MYKLKIVVDNDLAVARTEGKNCRPLTLHAIMAWGAPPALYDAFKPDLLQMLLCMQISIISKLCKIGKVHDCRLPCGEQRQFSYLFSLHGCINALSKHGTVARGQRQGE